MEEIMSKIEGVAATLLVLGERPELSEFRGERDLYILLSRSLFECADELKEIIYKK